jgi:hypothetical protein
MKRNILLSFLLVGLVVLEWGCMGWGGSCDPVPDEYHKITGFSDVWLASYQDNIVKDSASYDTIIFKLDVLHERLAHSIKTFFYQNGAYATEPCPPAPEVIVTEIDSLSVRTSLNGTITDVTALFAFSSQTYVDIDKIRSYTWHDLKDPKTLGFLNPISPYQFPSLVFGIAESPQVVLDSALTFQFFDTEGNIFETTTDPIIITP